MCELIFILGVILKLRGEPMRFIVLLPTAILLAWIAFGEYFSWGNPQPFVIVSKIITIYAVIKLWPLLGWFLRLLGGLMAAADVVWLVVAFILA